MDEILPHQQSLNFLIFTWLDFWWSYLYSVFKLTVHQIKLYSKMMNSWSIQMFNVICHSHAASMGKHLFGIVFLFHTFYSYQFYIIYKAQNFT